MEGDLVGRLIFAVLISILLHCIVRQVNIFVHILGSVLLAARPDVALSVKPKLIVGVQHPNADIELPALIQQRINITLSDVGLAFGEGLKRLQDMLDHRRFSLMNGDSVATV